MSSAAQAFYEDLVLADGTAYPHVFITRVEPDGLSYMHDQGVTKFYFHELSEDIQSKFNYDPEAAAIYTHFTQQLQQEWILQQEEAARIAGEEQQSRLDAIHQKESALKSKGGPRFTNLKLIHIQEDGSWLCQTFTHKKNPGFNPGRAKYSKHFNESQILVEGLPVTAADNDEWKGRIYETGIQQLKSAEGGPIRTLRKYNVMP